MKDFKRVLGIILIAATCLSLTACLNGDSTKPQATTQTNFVPEATNAPANAQDSQQSAFDWTAGAEQIEANVNKISEIADCRVVVDGTTALVGVRFADAYQGEVTERIREMVAAEVMKADPSIQTVAVTAEEEDVGSIYEIANQIRSGSPMDQLGNKIAEIVRNATTLR